MDAVVACSLREAEAEGVALLERPTARGTGVHLCGEVGAAGDAEAPLRLQLLAAAGTWNELQVRSAVRTEV